jgi:hypothetical protein
MQDPDDLDPVLDWTIEDQMLLEAPHPPHAQAFNACVVSTRADLRQIEQHGERTIDRREEAPRCGGIVAINMERLVDDTCSARGR